MKLDRHKKRNWDFEELKSFDPRKITDVDDLVGQLAKTPFISGDLGKAASILYDMTKDKGCLKVLTLSGAMTPAKMALVVCAMIENKMVDVVISTGALMSHGLVESLGMKHFRVPKDYSDEKLRDLGLNRIYTALELETNLDDVELIFAKVLEKLNVKTVSSYELCYYIGKYLSENVEGEGILKAAYEHKVPVFIPAFTDSELGLDFIIFNKRQRLAGKKEIMFDAFADLEKYASIVLDSKKMGIFTVGGGVPRNWGQQIGPYLDLMEYREVAEKGKNYQKSFSYGVRICPDAVELGHLSGCTYTEGVSWGKFISEKDGGKYSEVKTDATVAWPIIVTAVIQRLRKEK